MFVGFQLSNQTKYNVYDCSKSSNKEQTLNSSYIIVTGMFVFDYLLRYNHTLIQNNIQYRIIEYSIRKEMSNHLAFFLTTHRNHIPNIYSLDVSDGLAIFKVTISPAFFNRLVASVRFLPFIDSLFIPSNLSPICMAPVLK